MVILAAVWSLIRSDQNLPLGRSKVRGRKVGRFQGSKNLKFRFGSLRQYVLSATRETWTTVGLGSSFFLLKRLLKNLFMMFGVF